jgi:hypothetical protein
MLQAVLGEIAWKKDAGIIIMQVVVMLQKTGMEGIVLGAVIITVKKMDVGNIILIQVIVFQDLLLKD